MTYALQLLVVFFAAYGAGTFWRDIVRPLMARLGEQAGGVK